MSTTLIELAERCEKAEAADRRLDALIAQAVDTPSADDPDRDLAIHRRIIAKLLAGGDDSEIERYTASLDAAMTLAEGRGGQVTFFKAGTAKAFLWQPYPLAIEAKAATPALALCAAALKARGEQP